MTVSAPVSHLDDALTLTGDAVIDLFEIRLKTTPVTFRWWNGPTRTYLGDEYTGMACQLTGEARSSDGKNNRPNLTVVNPESAWTPLAADGYFDLAEITRKRVLQQHFLNNVSEYETRIWLVGRVANVTGQVMQLELRSTTDMPAWKTPRRTYSPPDYPFVMI